MPSPSGWCPSSLCLRENPSGENPLVSDEACSDRPTKEKVKNTAAKNSFLFILISLFFLIAARKVPNFVS
jgi:hypothetical protein